MFMVTFSRRCLILLFLIFVCVLSLSKTFADDMPSTNVIAEFHRSFKAADPKAKRELVIAAVDSGLIKRGLSLDDTKRMFGADFQAFRRESTKAELNAVVFFEASKPASNPMMSALRQGWYIDLVFSSDDKLERYSLSNLHK